ncbi:hypothetical protein IMCC9480_1309 [Oxalobacteraceae bacterium IMCC9480]|nr:hypothetical protein IMCC9480_1309 [Oxalobacteraceae bacterium IMCC9480]
MYQWRKRLTLPATAMTLISVPLTGNEMFLRPTRIMRTPSG